VSLTAPPAFPADIARMTATEILSTYGPEVYRLVSDLQAGGQMVRDGRSHHDLAITQAMRERLLAEGDCSCGKLDCWKEEMGR
jgi:hypothetical protein